jgi:hypothetical protein
VLTELIQAHLLDLTMHVPGMCAQGTLTDVRLVTVCARQAITWDISKLCRVKTADFVADVQVCDLRPEQCSCTLSHAVFQHNTAIECQGNARPLT